MNSGIASPPASSREDCRCECGKLLARLTPEGIELKCRGCKRTLRLVIRGDRVELRDPERSVS